jgi:hypothetical protein
MIGLQNRHALLIRVSDSPSGAVVIEPTRVMTAKTSWIVWTQWIGSMFLHEAGGWTGVGVPAWVGGRAGEEWLDLLAGKAPLLANPDPGEPAISL